MNDNLALLVGRVILEFAEFDQGLYGQIFVLNSSASRSNPSGGELLDVDDRFEQRLGLYRKLCRTLSGDDSGLMNRFDRFRTHVGELKRKRAHLAHGHIREADDGLEVFDYREIDAYQRAHGKARESKPNTHLEALWQRHINIRYSPEDLGELARQIRAATDELRQMTREAKRIFDARGRPQIL